MTATSVTEVDRGARHIARSVMVDAPAAQVFALVADPHRHPELDGSGTVRDSPSSKVKGPDLLSEGARFTVPMKQYGVSYVITSKVTAFETDRLVEWQHPGGHRWRWELEEVAPGRTRVTEVFDWTTSKAPWALELLRMPGKNAAGITGTLEALATRFG